MWGVATIKGRLQAAKIAHVLKGRALAFCAVAMVSVSVFSYSEVHLLRGANSLCKGTPRWPR